MVYSGYVTHSFARLPYSTKLLDEWLVSILTNYCLFLWFSAESNLNVYAGRPTQIYQDSKSKRGNITGYNRFNTFISL